MYVESQRQYPNVIYASLVDTISRKITFNWSPVAPNCPAIHYNINTSNCGNCPTTTNHTTVTCTDIPDTADNATCTFAIQAVTCEIIIGKLSNPIVVLLETSMVMTSDNSQSKDGSSDNTNHSYFAALASACFFAVGWVVSIVIVLGFAVRSKMAQQQIIALEAAPTTQCRAASEMRVPAETGYEIMMPVSAEHINTNENIAYDHIVR